MSLTEEAIDKIKDMIASGELRPGDRLPREADLAERLGLSRNSLREAVRALSLVRVLDVRQGAGTYVTSLEPALLLEAIGFVIDFHHDDTVLHYFEVRRLLEPAATAMAAVTMTDGEAAALLGLLDQLASQPTVEELVENDMAFHQRITASCGNPVLWSLIDGLSGPTQRARIWRGLTQEDAVERTLAEHRAIAEAIQTREPELARSWATVHVAGVEQWLERTLASRDGDQDPPAHARPAVGP